MSIKLAKHKLEIQGAFNEIGNSRPKHSDNIFPLIWDYFVADLLASLATKRKEHAKKALEDIGVLTKPSVGESKIIYSTDGLQIVGQTKQPSETIDRAKLNSELIKRYGLKVATDILKASTKVNNPATVYSFVGE